MKNTITISILLIFCTCAVAQDEIVNGKLTISDKLVIDNEGNLPVEGNIAETSWGNYILTNNYLTRTLRLGVSNDGYTRGEIEIENNNSPSSNIFFKTSNANGGASVRMKIAANGNVGIGTTTPYAKLEVRDGNLRVSNGTDRIYLKVDEANAKSLIAFGDDPNDRLGFYYDHWNGTASDVEVMSIMASGKVGIGTTTPDAKLTVKGNIHAEEVKVDLSVPGPDYVFKEGYALKSLEEIQNYIKAHGHLPNIPSAKEMEVNGVELGTMNMKLLEKIEELTLYTIQQQKILEDLVLQNKLQKQEINQLKTKIK